MKTIKILLTCVIALFFIASCKKDKKVPEKTVQEKILGKWNVISEATESINPPNPPKTSTKPGQAGDYFDFRNDGNVYYVLNSKKEQNINYHLKSDTEIVIEDGIHIISELSDRRFVFYITQKEDNETYTRTFTLGR